MILVATIQREVAEHYGLPVEAMHEPRGFGTSAPKRSHPRQAAMYLATCLTRHSYVRIGQLFNRDHSTVMHAMHRTEQRLRTDKEIEQDVRSVTRRLLMGDAA